MKAYIRAIESYFPDTILDNQHLAAEITGWSPEKIEEKTGIAQRHIAAKTECSSDMAYMAAKKLFDSGVCQPEDIDYLLLCTQSPDYYLPTTACLLQERLGLKQSIGALDFNLGCSGFIFGLQLVKALIETNQAQNVLLLTAETYSKFINPKDRSVRTLFGDAAAATLIQGDASTDLDMIGPFVLGTDGRGWRNLIVPVGGLRERYLPEGEGEVGDESGNFRNRTDLYMNGPEIFNFAMRIVPENVRALLNKVGCAMEAIDLFVFHQANAFILNSLRKKLNIPSEKYVIAVRDCGNTVSSSIPLALKEAVENGRLHPGDKVVLAGFGVGYSWGSALIRWKESK